MSSSEATAELPDKNVCRDVTRARVNAAISGYAYKSKDNIRRVDGVGGEFAYLRTRRIPAEKVFSEAQHDQVWIALQLIHIATVSPLQEGKALQIAITTQGVVIYVMALSETSIAEVRTVIGHHGHATIYSWQPALLEHRISDPRVSFAPIPQFLVNRFGAGARK